MDSPVVRSELLTSSARIAMVSASRPVVSMSSRDTTSERSEIEERILYAIVRKPDGFPAGAVLRINPSRQASWALSDLSYGEFAEVLRAARRLITGARAGDHHPAGPFATV